jgi:site-specific recombinase XerD
VRSVPAADPLRLAINAYLGRFKGSSREHTGSDLRVFVTWCSEHGVQPLAAQRADLELYVRWMQETRRFKPSTVSRRISVLAGFYRTCVIDGALAHSPAEHVRRPTVPADSPTLGLTHLQFEAMLSAAGQSTNDCDFALVVMLGLLGLRIFEATGVDIGDLGEEHGHRVLPVVGKGAKNVLVPLPPAAVLPMSDCPEQDSVNSWPNCPADPELGVRRGVGWATSRQPYARYLAKSAISSASRLG